VTSTSDSRETETEEVQKQNYVHPVRMYAYAKLETPAAVIKSKSLPNPSCAIENE
jgi:hypothetical protein